MSNSNLSFNGAAVKQIGSPSLITLIGNQLNFNSVGVQSFAGSTVDAFGNTLTNNTTFGFDPSGGTISSDGQNNRAGNASDGAPNGTPLSKY
jgi:hypothetical protein